MIDDLMDDVVFDVIEKEREAEKKKRKSNLFLELESLTDENISPSSLYNSQKEEKKKEKEEKKKEKEKDEEVIDDEWLETLTNFSAPKTKKKSKFTGSVEDYIIGKKKKGGKKKDKDKGKIVSHKKDFDAEMSLLKDLYKDQSNFVDSLQKKYDQLDNMKSSVRGVGKFTTDLIMSLNSARTLNSSILNNIISLKKTIADLDFKERKEFGGSGSGEGMNAANYASNYLKQIISAGRNNIGASQESYDSFDDLDDDDDDSTLIKTCIAYGFIYEDASHHNCIFVGYDDDGIASSISDALGDMEREEEVNKYLKYENRFVKVKVIWHTGYAGDDFTKQYDFIAVDADNNVVSDYPVPLKTSMIPNFSTQSCTDKYGTKYDMIMDNE